MNRDDVMKALKEQGFRITNQRKLIVDVILSEECSSCKEIYYKALERDKSIGIATVYRVVKVLEETGFIDRRNLYRLETAERENVLDMKL